MNVSDFEKIMQPQKKRSQLDPFIKQIFELKEKGYANWQISKFLEANGINVTQETVRQFTKNRENIALKSPIQLEELASKKTTEANISEYSTTHTSSKNMLKKKTDQYIKGGFFEADIDSLCIPDMNQE